MSDPRPEEFIEFHKLLTANAPDDFTPWYFRCESGSKAPDTSFGSWKSESARLSAFEAVQWMKSGGNVGIAGTDKDRLVNVDIDDEDETSLGELKSTLITRSRSRTGGHGFYFRREGEEIPNIPTDNAGEIRTHWQFVVAPGSYVEPDDIEEIPDDEREDAGYYTVEQSEHAAGITFDELPAVFRGVYESTERHREQEQTEPKEGTGRSDSQRGGEHPLFDITIPDLVSETDTTERWTSLFHGSSTEKNTCVYQGLLHCWRHNVSHNAYQAMVVLSGYQTCKQAGSPHKHSGVGPSRVSGDNEAMAMAWKWAKQNGHLGADVRPPIPALDWIVAHVTEEANV